MEAQLIRIILKELILQRELLWIFLSDLVIVQPKKAKNAPFMTIKQGRRSVQIHLQTSRRPHW
jgi:hypothetical protein